MRLNLFAIRPFLFSRGFKTQKLHAQLRPPLSEVIHPIHRVQPAIFKFKDVARYGVYSLESTRVRERSLKYIIDNDILPFIPSERDVYGVPCIIPYYRKKKGTKNGSGRAPVKSYYAKVKAGRLILEFNAPCDELAIKIYKRLRTRMPMKTYFRIRPSPCKLTEMSRDRFEGILSGRVIKPPVYWMKKNYYLK